MFVELISYHQIRKSEVSMEEVNNKFVAVKGHVNGAPAESDFEIKSETICLSIIKGSEVEVIVKNLYVSVDPYQLNRMKTQSSSQAAISFATAITPGHVCPLLNFSLILLPHIHVRRLILISLVPVSISLILISELKDLIFKFIITQSLKFYSSLSLSGRPSILMVWVE